MQERQERSGIWKDPGKGMKIQLGWRHFNKDLLEVYTVSLYLSSVDSRYHRLN